MIAVDIASVQFNGAFKWGKDLAGNLIVVRSDTGKEVALRARNGKCYLAFQQLKPDEVRALESLKLWGQPEASAGWQPFHWDYCYNEDEWTGFLDSIPKATVAPSQAAIRAGDEPPRMPPEMNGHSVDPAMLQPVRPDAPHEQLVVKT